MYESVLLATDGSPGADAATGHAVFQAQQNDAVMHAVHVTDTTDLNDISEAPGEPGEMDPETQQVLDPVLETADESGIDAVSHVLEGTPHEELTEYVAENEIDLVVIGTHGKTGLSRVLLGSTAEKVVRNSPAPVLTVRQPE